MSNGDCVEVAPAAQVRDSKLGDASPILTFTPGRWMNFIRNI
jgi:hypothetical protein